MENKTNALHNAAARLGYLVASGTDSNLIEAHRIIARDALNQVAPRQGTDIYNEAHTAGKNAYNNDSARARRSAIARYRAA